MRSRQIDLNVREAGGRLLVTPRGDFDLAHLPAFREKVLLLVSGKWDEVAFELGQTRFLDQGYLDFFGELLNSLHGRGTHLVLAFEDDENWRFFRRISNLVDIRPKADLPVQPGKATRLRLAVAALSRRTGLRISGGVALAMVILVAGWILTLVSLVRYQEEEIRRREARVLELESQQRETMKELEALQRTVGPMSDLGLLTDSLKNVEYDVVSDWVDYLDAIDAKKDSSAIKSGKVLP